MEVEGLMKVGQSWWEWAFGYQLWRQYCGRFLVDLTKSVNRRWRVLCQTAQQAEDGRIWWGQVREDLQDDLCPFQIRWSMSLPEMVATSKRVKVWR